MQQHQKSPSRFARAFGYFSLGLGASLLIGWWLKQEEHRSRQRSAMPHTHPPVPEVDEPIIVLSQKTLDSAPQPMVEVPPTPRDPSKEVTTPKGDPDNLTKIKGIGAKTSEALQALGIHRYQDLASRDPQQLTEALSDLRGISLDKVSAWIETAKQL